MSPGERDERRVDELRDQLRRLGYLNAGVDRFVLASAQRTRRPLSIAALAALRVGLLAAVLLGPAAALGIAARLPGLVTGARDAVLVALYLAVLFGVAAAIVTFLASVLVTRLPLHLPGTRARLVSRAAGTISGAGCLLYLTLWWRIANPDLATVSVWWTLLAIGVAVAISLLLGHAIGITTLAVLVARRGDSAIDGVTPRSQWRLTAAAAALGIAGAAALLNLTSQPVSSAPASPLAVVSPGYRVRVLAIDGFDPTIADAMIAEGQLPALARLFSQARVGVVPEEARDPARVWTTIATGQPADVHGVRGLETTRVRGLQGAVASEDRSGVATALRGATDLLRLTRPSIASGAELKSKTFWEVAADAGLRAAVVNWWATWPAVSDLPNPPLVVSDRAPLRLERGGEVKGEIAPDAVYRQLQPQWASIKQKASDTAAALVPETADSETTATLRRAAEVDAVQLELASRLNLATFDLVAIYLPGLDIAQHALLGGAGAAPSTLSIRLQGLSSYYRYLDTLLKDATATRDNEIVVVLTQPGRLSSRSAWLVLAGNVAGTPVEKATTVLDLAPTILYALGLPISLELPGRPVLDLFAPSFTTKFPLRSVDTYGRRPAPMARGETLDREMIERLRSLGYVR